MEIAWRKFFEGNRKRGVMAVWLIISAVAIYLGAIAPFESTSNVSLQDTPRTAGGARPALIRNSGIPVSARLESASAEKGRDKISLQVGATDQQTPLDDHKTIGTGSMELVVSSPRDTSDRIRAVAEHAGGFLVTSETAGGENASRASLTIRVPENKFEKVRNEIRKLGVRVESERIEAQDVTKQYVDQAARLRNLHAQETQYLQILKQAKKVKDMLEVSEQLNEVRGQIEEQQAEFDALSKQVETVALTVSLRAADDMQVFGLHWRPFYQLKVSLHEGLDAVAEYATTMASFLFYLPAVLLWLVTIGAGALIGWRVLRRAGQALFLSGAKGA